MKFVHTALPTAEPVSLAEIKRQVRVDASDDDQELSAMIAAAREVVEQQTRRQLMQATLRGYLDRFPTFCGPIEIPLLPITDVTLVSYYDANGEVQSLDSSTYYADIVSDKSPGRLMLVSGQTWPTTQTGRPNAVMVDFDAGYTTVPDAAKHAIKLLVAHWYNNREAVGQVGREVALAFGALIQQLQWTGLAGVSD